MALTAPVCTDLTDEVRRIVRLVLAELEEPCPVCAARPGPRPLSCSRCTGHAVVPTALGAHALTTLKGTHGRRGALVGRAGTALTPKSTRTLIDAARVEWEIFADRHGH